ncbi:flavodoxin-dependent (E)-4-hydroxy-3-methylbut-2-enyl-diphosphate synthase, partial [bacterium]|nr:flavodoxin-dependent (E)-4-hydroxy-3-methylbut-2-enyl-diphosphate synthase [bacterium]
MNYLRRKSDPIRLGKVQVGGGAPISVQTMTKTDTRDVTATSKEIERLSLSGCDVIRLAVPDMAAAEALSKIVRNSILPVIADIHFDHNLALKALENGVHGLRINPG